MYERLLVSEMVMNERLLLSVRWSMYERLLLPVSGHV